MLGTALRAIYIAIKLNDSDFYRRLSQVNQATDEAVKKIKQMNDALEELGKYMAGVGAVGQAGIGLAVKQFADFEQAFVNLKKVMPQDRDFERIQKSAEAMAKYYGRSVEDILGVMELWARQGKNTEEELEKLTNATLLWATAENLDVRQATEYLTYILNGFNLRAEEAIRVVDALNEVSNNFATDSVKLAQSLQEAAGVAHQYGVTLEELIGYATALHSAGYQAGEAGNFLAYTFSRLYEDNVAELLEQAGVQVKKQTENLGQHRKS
jgi:TP901 family phage tail tape measure protein